MTNRLLCLSLITGLSSAAFGAATSTTSDSQKHYSPTEYEKSNFVLNLAYTKNYVIGRNLYGEILVWNNRNQKKITTIDADKQMRKSVELTIKSNSNVFAIPYGNSVAVYCDPLEPTHKKILTLPEKALQKPNIETDGASATKQPPETFTINLLRFAPDGKTLAGCSSYGTIILWDATRNYKPIGILFHEKVIKTTAMTITNDNTIFTGSNGGMLYKWKYKEDGSYTTSLVHQFENTPNILAADAHPLNNNQLVISVNEEGNNCFYTLDIMRNSMIARHISTEEENNESHLVLGIKYSPNGHFFALSSSDGKAYLCEIINDGDISGNAFNSGISDLDVDPMYCISIRPMAFSQDSSRFLYIAANAENESIIEHVVAPITSSLQELCARIIKNNSGLDTSKLPLTLQKSFNIPGHTRNAKRNRSEGTPQAKGKKKQRTRSHSL